MPAASSLHNLQRRFMAALYGLHQAGDDDWIIGAGLEPAARLRIYRHSSEQIHVAALRIAYPAVLALVGEACFEQAARRFREAHPARQGNLQRYGEGFDAFLVSLPQTRHLAYLGDVARLEWLRQEVALAADVSPLPTGESVRALACARNGVRVTFRPDVRLFASGHPVATIWRYAMHPRAERLTLGTAGERILLWREAGQVAMAVLPPASFACVDALARGLSLDAAHEAACAVDAVFDLSDCMAGLLENGLVVTFNPDASLMEVSCSSA